MVEGGRSSNARGIESFPQGRFLALKPSVALPVLYLEGGVMTNPSCGLPASRRVAASRLLPDRDLLVPGDEDTA